MAALRSKIVELELKHRVHRMAQKTELMEIKMQAALEKKDQEQKMEKKDLEQKLEKKDLEQKLEKKDLEKKVELMEIKMQAALEKKDQEQKMEVTEIKMQAALEKKGLEQKMEKKDLEQKMELMEIKMQASLEKRDREAEKKETQHQIENEKRDRETDKRETQHQIENEKRDRETDKREMQLKWEARFGQLEQQLHTMQPLTNPVQNTARLNLAQQTANEELMLERLQLRQLERLEKETGSSHPIASATAVQAATLHSTAASALLPSAVGLSAPIGSTNASAARPLSTRPVDAGAAQEQRQSAPSASNAPSRIVQQQPRQQVATGPEPARTAAVALPSDARMHFFLSHCQGTGGDQTNAIYLELRQLGFACWYSAL
jgi:hypothetical protein